MADEHVVFKFGGDKTSLDRALRGINSDVRSFANTASNSLKNLQKGFQGFSRFNFLLNITNQLQGWMDKAKEIGQFWGAFSAGGEKAVQQLDNAKTKADELWQQTKKLRKEREEREKTEKEVQTAIRDITLERASDEEKLNTLSRERDVIFSKLMKSEEFSSAHQKAKLELLNKENEIYKLNADMATKKAKAEEESRKQLELQNNVIAAQNALKTASADRFKNTLGELANQKSPQGDAARKATDLQAQAEQARLNGDAAGAANLSAQADEIIGGTGGKETKETLSLKRRADAARRGGAKGFADGLMSKRDELMNGLQGLRSGEKADPMADLKKAYTEALKEYAKENGGALPVNITTVSANK